MCMNERALEDRISEDEVFLNGKEASLEEGTSAKIII